MSGGGPAQARRRARRAAARVAAAQAALTDDFVALPEVAAASEPETFDSEEPYGGECATCGDMADDHAGSMNDGACAVEGCDCGSFRPMPVRASSANEGAGVLTLTFTSVGGNTVSVNDNFNGFFTTEDLRGFMNTGITIWDNSTGGFDLIDYAGATAPNMPDEHQEHETLPPQRPHPAPPEGGMADGDIVTDADAEVDEPESADDARNEQAIADGITGKSGMSWEAMIAPEGQPTDDGRIFAPGGITWRELPLSLGAMFDTPHADVVTASPVVGRIDEIWRDGGNLYARGVFDDGELGQDVARMVKDGILRGVSVDVAIGQMSIEYKSDILDADGNWKAGDAPSEGGPNMLDILFDPNPDEEPMFVIWNGTIGAVTICPFPAFADARIEIAKSLVATVQSEVVWTVTVDSGVRIIEVGTEPHLLPTIAASATAVEEETTHEFPVVPPRVWFENPDFDCLTALTVTDDGHIYGHAAAWGVCHIGIPGACTTAPQSESGYAYFHLKEIECEGGEYLSCGTITLDTGHASHRMSRAETTRHYDDTGTAVADVVCGEDEFGIWFSGSVRSTIDGAGLRKLRGSVLSGDWRATSTTGPLELVALLAVNVPGFPVPRHERAMLAAAGDHLHLTALVSAGVVTEALLTASERAQFDALSDMVDGEFDDLAAQAAKAAE